MHVAIQHFTRPGSRTIVPIPDTKCEQMCAMPGLILRETLGRVRQAVVSRS